MKTIIKPEKTKKLDRNPFETLFAELDKYAK